MFWRLARQTVASDHHGPHDLRDQARAPRAEQREQALRNQHAQRGGGQRDAPERDIGQERARIAEGAHVGGRQDEHPRHGEQAERDREHARDDDGVRRQR